ncbi:Pyruvate, phosphate dikinase [Candidatus Fokinia solitaria]|uniref:Pyruvate, phosphate dikinase n=1 Tax=Candidatus Fokinia solitaria TaxID=1802984 RepID=A0A2U8BT35_9RICK|nr:pyruvate, phosphate dikinase [Candidatus Fokinia solitaria]AWD33524.1 Pyruvate, phosphate dikinase [Candidatus Fokinia solitaria]
MIRKFYESSVSCSLSQSTEKHLLTEERFLLGGKGQKLYEMHKLGIKVPYGFTITTEVYKKYAQNFADIDFELPHTVKTNLVEAVNELSAFCNKPFAQSSHTPLLLSVRSGAPFSMPGMMETVLNVGLNDETVESYVKQYGESVFIYDTYKRLLEMYGNVVLNIPRNAFEDLNHSRLSKHPSKIEALKFIIEDYKKLYKTERGFEFPQDCWTQLFSSVEAVFRSWNNDRACHYRNIHHIPHDIGTAVNIQMMVFGNFNSKSYTGVVFSRNPSTGENALFGEYLENAQGEDVVSGYYNACPLTSSSKRSNEQLSFEERESKLFQELEEICKKLDCHYNDMQDIEFTVENGVLWILQTRNGKRSSNAAIKIASQTIRSCNSDSTTISILNKLTVEDLQNVMHPVIDDEKHNFEILSKGLPASPGVASGVIAFSTKQAEVLSKHGNVILVRKQTSPDDILGMNVSAGILTAKGGMTSHAAVVARGMGKPCVCAADFTIIEEDKKVVFGEQILFEGSEITINGTTGDVIKGVVKTIAPKLDDDFWYILALANKIKTTGVYANAETEDDIKTAIHFGAEGIGLCRTEHMFFGEERIPIVQSVILEKDITLRKQHLQKLIECQKDDFLLIMSLMNGNKVTIRLLDPPIHEFLPHSEAEKNAFLAYNAHKYSAIELDAIVENTRENNPMMGNRGCRLGITYPDIYVSQIIAICSAIKSAVQRNIFPNIGIMVPFVFDEKELMVIFQMIRAQISEILHDVEHSAYAIKLGAMIELPRAAIIADRIARISDFISFGTNDLTQMTYGMSRDDSSKFEESYIENGVFSDSPFNKFDIEGVGELMRIAIKKVRVANPNIVVSVCGEHCAEKEAVNFFLGLGVDYLSCSPHRIPITKLLSAQYCSTKEQHQ